MPFSIEYSDQALATIEGLERQVGKRIVAKLGEATKNPLHYFQRMSNSELYKLRAGDYRMLAELSFARETIFVVKIGHRKNVYD